jgi:hypothetical protein
LRERAKSNCARLVGRAIFRTLNADTDMKPPRRTPSLRFGALFLAAGFALAACGHAGAGEALSGSSVDSSVPRDLQDGIATAQILGAKAYFESLLSMMASAALAAQPPATRVGELGLAGSVALRELEAGGSTSPVWVVSYYTADSPHMVRVQVRLPMAREEQPSVREVNPPVPTTVEMERIIRARLAAVAALPSRDQDIKPLVVEASNGLLVYLIASQKQPDLAVLGKHQRAVVTTDGARVTNLQTLSDLVLEVPAMPSMPMRGPASSAAQAAVGKVLKIDHHLGPAPNEAHVFVTLKHQIVLHVVTSLGTWAVDRGKIRLLPPGT